MNEDTDQEKFPAMLRRVLADRLAPGLDTFPDMFAEDGVLEYPFAPPGLVSPLAGRAAIVANFQKIRGFLRIDAVFGVTDIATRDPDLVVLEFYGRGAGLLTGEPYDQRYISVIRLRRGRIAQYTDYWNPLALIRAAAGGEAIRLCRID